MKISVKTLIGLLSVCSIILLVMAFIFLNTMEPLQDNTSLHTVVADILSKDPKAQRNNVNTDPLASDILAYLNPLKHYLSVLMGVSIVLNGISLTLLRSRQHFSGIFLICAAAASFLTIIPTVLQLVSGVYLIKTGKRTEVV